MGLIQAMLLLLALGVAGPASAVGISLVAVPGAGGTDVSALSVQADGEDLLFPMSVPFSAAHSTGATSSSESQYDFSGSGFLVTFDHSRAVDGFAQSSGEIYFTVDNDAQYLLEGVYSAGDPSGRSINQSARVIDRTSDMTLFNGKQQSLQTPHEVFSLGGLEGDFENGLVGALAGQLLAGHVYEYRFNAFLDATAEPAPTGATAGGYFELQIVPEPSAALLLAVGILAVWQFARAGAGHRIDPVQRY